MKDDSFPSTPPPYYPDILCDSVIPIESCEEFPSNDIITSDSSLTSKCEEEISYVFDIPNLSSHHYDTIKGEISCFRSSPFMIHQIMRMSLFLILKFMIMVVVIFSPIHLIMTLFFSLLNFLSHRCLMIYLLMIWNFCKLLRNFSLR